MELNKYVKNAKYYIEEFAKWEATEIIVDDKRAIWTLQSPTEKWRKVCLFKDCGHLYVYGDYGNFTFDSMTWDGTVYNLAYDNLGYQAGKLSYESRQSLFGLFDDVQCLEDIYEWLTNWLEENNYKEEKIKEIVDFFDRHSTHHVCDYEIEEFCEDEHISELSDLLIFVNDALEHTDEYEWIAFLRRTDFSEFDEECESELWNAGKTTHERYYICMYALQVCKEKLSAASK